MNEIVAMALATVPATDLTIEVETWTDVHHPTPLDDRLRRFAIGGPGGVSIVVERGAGRLLIEVDNDGRALVTVINGSGVADDDSGPYECGAVAWEGRIG